MFSSGMIYKCCNAIKLSLYVLVEYKVDVNDAVYEQSLTDDVLVVGVNDAEMLGDLFDGLDQSS